MGQREEKNGQAKKAKLGMVGRGDGARASARKRVRRMSRGCESVGASDGKERA